MQRIKELIKEYEQDPQKRIEIEKARSWFKENREDLIQQIKENNVDFFDLLEEMNKTIYNLDLLPCPVCKTDIDIGPSWDENGNVWYDCECGFEDNGYYSSLEEAEEGWNKYVQNNS